MIRFDFPSDFLWGAGSSSFQVEGGADADGRGPSVWDIYSLRYPDRFYRAQTPAIAVDFYHHYAEDVLLMRDLGLKTFRLSISWSRVLPNGRGPVNEPGLAFYDRLIDLLLKHNIKPFVDLYHWDLPWALAEEGGFSNPRIVADFEQYACVYFERLGNRVSYWNTMNEPAATSCFNPFAPENDDPVQLRRGELNILLMHFAAVQLYRAMNLPGKIGTVLAYVPYYSNSLSEADQTATRLQTDFVLGRWLDPMLKGTYPQSLMSHPHLASVLSAALQEKIGAAFTLIDFMGLNYYTPTVIANTPGAFLDSGGGEPFAAQQDYGFTIYPAGLYDSLQEFRARYGDIDIYNHRKRPSHGSGKTAR
ncbi:MAG: family 1 glycosylhydrolase [Candidatus Omnitrophota bacterium]